MARRSIVASLFVIVLSGLVLAQLDAPEVIFDMDTARHEPGVAGEGNPLVGDVLLTEGKFGDACYFEFVVDGPGFCTASVQATDAWSQADGISFWVKGDGSDQWGGLELIDRQDYALRYGYCFPLDSTEWQKITVPWQDLIPELPAGKLVDAEAGYAPSGFGNLWFGKWYYWREYPPISFVIDQIVLEPEIQVDETDYTPAETGLPRLRAKLEAGEPVTVVTMGDSLSDKRHWANREVLWSELLVAQLKERFGGEATLVNPAIGGTQLTQNLVLMPQWLRDTPAPDLVTVCFGYNDWDSGMRGEHYAEMLRFAVDRIRRMTEGKSEILLMTTCPAVERWTEMDGLAEAARTVAAEKRTGLADLAAAFHQAAPTEADRPALYVDDRTHLSPAGHALVAETVMAAIGEDDRAGPDADRVALPEPSLEGAVPLEEAIAARRSVREFADVPLTWAEIGQLLWAAQGITEPTRGLRAAPSAGSTYPLELYCVTPDGLYHYLPEGHALEMVAEGDLRPTLGATAGGQAGINIIIAAAFERTAARFGEDAERYVYLEAGHAAQNILLQAVALGLGSVPVGGINADEVAAALDLPEGHRPIYGMPVGHPRQEREGG